MSSTFTACAPSVQVSCESLLQCRVSRWALEQLQTGSLPKAAVLFCQPAHKNRVTAAQELATMQVEPVGFEAVADEGSQTEVSRLFSAMLQLINNGNIQILPGQAQQPFQLRLLKTELLHRQFLEGPAITAHASKVMLLCHRVSLGKALTVLSAVGVSHCIRTCLLLSFARL